MKFRLAMLLIASLHVLMLRNNYIRAVIRMCQLNRNQGLDIDPKLIQINKRELFRLHGFILERYGRSPGEAYLLITLATVPLRSVAKKVL